ncbi:MAG TPA: MerR family transcriptional regulator [Verrucomicrobiae bacterium]|nr:MerR family transcriptional regulator [Verrucomicrobiae bacterium]
MTDAHHSIRAVVRRTGLSAHVIRIWEKRYGAIRPERTPTNRRLYSDEQIERLHLLRELTRDGHSIGAVANLPLGQLKQMASKGGSAADSRTPAQPSLLDECIRAVRGLDAEALEGALKRGAVELGAQGVLQRVIAPLTQKIGDLWCNGTITAAHEHFASAVIRVFLGHASRSFAATQSAPALVVGTPSGQLHELGALLAGAAAENLGWHVTYLGPGLPAAEIAGAATQSRARAVALSLVYPEDDPKLEGELMRLRELLPRGLPLLVGGRAAPAYESALIKIAALQIKDLDHLCSVLASLRKPASKQKK